MKEAGVESHVRLEAARLGFDLWRNNVGVLIDDRGRPVRYGLANDSAKLNKAIKSSDLIGITPVMITQDMVGTVVGIFTAVETKHPEWVYRASDAHSVAQKNFHDIVKKSGGLAGFAKCVEDYIKIIQRKPGR